MTPLRIQVYNLHEDEWDGAGEYIGRPSILGNPYRIGPDGTREQVIERCRQRLWQIVQRGRAGEFDDPGITDVLTDEVKCCLRKGEWDHPLLPVLVWRALVRLRDRASRGEPVNLLCYCKPKPCHGDVIKACLEWLVKGNA